MAFSSLSQLYDAVRVRLRLDESDLSDSVAQTLFASWARDFSDTKPEMLIVTTTMTGRDIMDGNFSVSDDAAHLTGIVQVLGVYPPGSNIALPTFINEDDCFHDPYLVVRGTDIRGVNLDSDGEYAMRFRTRYKPIPEPAFDPFLENHGSLVEHGLMLRVLQWQKADPAEILPVQAEYSRIYKDANRPVTKSRGRFPRG